MKKVSTENSIKIAFFIAVVLACVKMFVAVFSGSMAVFASALDSVFDSVSSAGNFWAAKKSKAGPTKNFKYGFGKIEGLFGLFQGGLISASGCFLAIGGVLKILYGGEIKHFDVLFGVMIFSVLVTLALVVFLKKNKDSSLILESETAHYSSDILANLAVLLGILIIYFTDKFWLDGAISIVLAGMIIWSGVTIFKKSVFYLLDREVDHELNDKIEGVLERYLGAEKITSYHFLRTRTSGSVVFVDAHLVFMEDTLLKKAHDIADEIEAELTELIPEGDILFHLDPFDDSADQ